MDRRDPGQVAQRLSHGGSRLPCGGVLRPDRRDRLIECRPAGVNLAQRSQCDERLADGVHIDEGVGSPRSLGCWISPPAHQVDDHPVAMDDAQPGTDLSAQREVLFEGSGHGLESRCADATNDRRHDESVP